jgi:hypothetical protein
VLNLFEDKNDRVFVMNKVKTENAVGKALGADVTEIILGVKKGPLFLRKDI